MYIQYNPNPKNQEVGDCTVRALCRLTEKDWDSAFMDLVSRAYYMKDMPSSNAVLGRHLRGLGYKRHAIPDSCPDCYTIEEFCNDHKYGRYLLGTGTHVVACVDGNYYDTWDSGKKIPLYYYSKD